MYSWYIVGVVSGFGLRCLRMLYSAQIGCSCVGSYWRISWVLIVSYIYVYFLSR